MANVTWTTPAGSLGIINERDLFSKQLEANSADSTVLTYTKIAGTLPPGIRLTSAGLLRGTPFEVARRSLYTFVIRVSDGINITDRTFSFQVQGADIPQFTTASGQLDLSDTTRVGNKWVLDGSYIEFQIEATDTDTATGQTLIYDISNGRLPPGVTMSTSGLISGTILLTDDERFGVYGGWDNIYGYDDVSYDPLARSVSRSENFEFVVRVSDGASVVEQVNSIFVFTADFWRVDNDRLTVDQESYQNYPLKMSLSANRRPVFETNSNLGIFRHDNQCVIKIDVVDFDTLQTALEYIIVSGSLPNGIDIDLSSGELYGQLPTQSAVSSEYSFTIRARRTPLNGATVFSDKAFTMTIIGDIDIGIAFTSGENLGELTVGLPSLISLSAEASTANRVLYYNKKSGSLPPGISLSADGHLMGTPELTEVSTVDLNSITFDDNTTTLDKKYLFTVTVSDQYQSQATDKDFYVTIKSSYSKQYGNISGYGFINNKGNSSERELFYEISQDLNINNKDYIFRQDDTNFGIKKSPEILLVSGLEYQTLSALQNAMENNHAPKDLYFGDIKTAIAKQGGNTIYEVIYLEMKDNQINNLGSSISSTVTLRNDINKPLNGPRADDFYVTSDDDVYNVTTDGGLSFSISGSKLRYANPLSADLGYFEKLYPNAIEHMRKNLKNLGHKEYVHLPLWMRTAQDNTGIPLGYTPAVVLAYCKPGQSALVKKRILDKKIDYKKIAFKIERYVVSASKVNLNDFVTDGSTKTFELNEIVHEEEIKIRENANVLRYGNQITADNETTPAYLSTDTLLRSADYEPQFSLSHNATTQKTTINFTNAPAPTSKIRVERNSDKYLAFKKKLRE